MAQVGGPVGDWRSGRACELRAFGRTGRRV